MSLDLSAFIKKHLKFHETVEYANDGQELVQLIEMAKPILCREGESALAEVKIPVKIVGDIHGQFFDLQRIFLSLGLPGANRYLFLGDYVDRGANSIECISLLLALKILAPKQIFLLRGNHECSVINRVYGLWAELNGRFKIGIAMKVYNEINTIFSHLPLAALVSGKILCMHGGISPRLNSLDDIRKISLPIENPANETLEQDLLWSDPLMNLSGFEFNKLRDVSVCFGENEVQKTCKKLGLDFIVRAHQVMPNGYGFFANRKLVTVFSAPRYQPDLNNSGAILNVDKNKRLSFVIFNPVDSLQEGGAENFKRTYSSRSVTPSSNASK
jgi:diadenosine tetraphosphatase ApaH/serine/threonine PP2A family protein phosphatase